MDRIIRFMVILIWVMVSGCASNIGLVENSFKNQTTDVLQLLDEAANPNQVDERGRTPLHLAVLNGNETLVRTLLRHDADIDAEDNNGHTPLYFAVTGNNKAQQFIQLLVQEGADINIGSPVLYAKTSEDMMYLINNGADIHGTGPEGLSSLHFGASKGYNDVVLYLLQAGLDINSTVTSGHVYSGYTPLMIAAKQGQLDSVKLLLMNGADVTITGQDGETANSLVERDNPYFGVVYNKIGDVLSGAYKLISSTDAERLDNAKVIIAKPIIQQADDISQIPETKNISTSNAIAIIIGNKNYTKKNVPEVSFAHNDAQSVKDVLINEFGYDPKNILYELDASLATLNQLFGTKSNPKGKAFNWVWPDESDLFIYYVGHGAPDTNSKSAYFVPVDADVDYLEASGYPLNLFYQNISKIPASLKTAAAFSGCFWSSNRRT